MDSISFNGNQKNIKNGSALKAATKGSVVGAGILLGKTAVDCVYLSYTAKKFSNWTKENPKCCGGLNFKDSFKKVWEYFKYGSNVRFDKDAGLITTGTLKLKKSAPIVAGTIMAGSIAVALIGNAIKNSQAKKAE